ncbi:MAG: hypothetical protein IJW43_02010 [Clostridia bacterium]|nr:hypothetical protein [Clostridia bacterium]
MENKTKAQTFIGFAMRKGSFKIGVNAIYTLRRASLLIVCSTAGADTNRQAIKLARRFNCRLLKIIRPLKEVTYRENAKLMAITDIALANAIIENGKEEFIEVDLGE